MSEQIKKLSPKVDNSRTESPINYETPQPSQRRVLTSVHTSQTESEAVPERNLARNKSPSSDVVAKSSLKESKTSRTEIEQNLSKKEKESNKRSQNEIKTCLLKLKKSKNYFVSLQYYDDTQSESCFYVNVNENLPKIEQLDANLQQESSDKSKFYYINKISDINVEDKLEALYDSDSKWYRVSVKELDLESKCAIIYFLDFGNSQKIDLSSFNDNLRFRLKYDDKAEMDLFKLEYQAVRCCYSSQNNKTTEPDSLQSFLDNLMTRKDFDKGFMINVKEILNDRDGETYVVDFSNETVEKEDTLDQTLDQTLIDADKEVSNILEDQDIVKPIAQYAEQFSLFNKNVSKFMDIDLPENSSHQVSVVHVESIKEFYVQTSDHLKTFLEQQQRIQNLLDIVSSKKAYSSIPQAKTQMFQVGDYVFAKFLADLSWYRGVITDAKLNDKPTRKNPNLLGNQIEKIYFLLIFSKRGNYLTQQKLKKIPASPIWKIAQHKQTTLSMRFILWTMEIHSIK